jgi:hypothetical protein
VMKKTIFTILICASIATSTLAAPHGVAQYGGKANYTRLPNHYAGSGGEFTLYNHSVSDPLLLSNSAYASTTSGLGGMSESFQTFCLETDEYTRNNVDVYVSLSAASSAVPGTGSHAYGGGSDKNFGDDGDDLDPKTAYLYDQFAKGTLSGYNFGSGSYMDLSRSKTAGALQRLIWATEGEGGDDFTVSFFNISLDANQQALIGIWNDEYNSSGWSGIGDVRVLQIVYQSYYGGTWNKQDFLYVTPVPGAVLLGMLGLAVAGVKLRKHV